MPPRIRSFLSRLPFRRGGKIAAAPEAPRVFREFVETLQRLDPPPEKHAARAVRPRRRRYAGNGTRRPSTRSRPR